jgi:glycerol uptake facilitator-like aquaporin
MLGTMILILVGTGVNCQFALSADAGISPSPKGSYLGFNIAWGCGPSSLRIFLHNADCDHSCRPGRVGFRWGVWGPY